VRRFLAILALTAVFLVLAVLSALLVFKFEGTPPKLLETKIPEVLGRKAEIALELADRGSGLRVVRVYLVQKENAVLLFEKEFPVDPFWGSRVKEKLITLSFEPLKQGFKDGKAEIVLEVRDASWRNKLKGNIFRAKKEVLLDLSPPRIKVLSPLHYLVPGGSNLVLYRLFEPAKRHGVRLDDLFFKGYAVYSAHQTRGAQNNAWLDFVVLHMAGVDLFDV